VACWWLASAVNWPPGLVGLLLQNGLCAGLAVGLYGLLASAAGVPEARQLLTMVRRRKAA
jgi:putative peptidoglycan lipid II flippase